MAFEEIFRIIENPPLLIAALVSSLLFLYLQDEPQKKMRAREMHFYELDSLWKKSKNPKREYLSVQDEISLDSSWKEAKRKYNIYNSLAYISVAVGIYAFFG